MKAIAKLSEVGRLSGFGMLIFLALFLARPHANTYQLALEWLGYEGLVLYVLYTLYCGARAIQVGQLNLSQTVTYMLPIAIYALFRIASQLIGGSVIAISILFVAWFVYMVMLAIEGRTIEGASGQVLLSFVLLSGIFGFIKPVGTYALIGDLFGLLPIALPTAQIAFAIFGLVRRRNGVVEYVASIAPLMFLTVFLAANTVISPNASLTISIPAIMVCILIIRTGVMSEREFIGVVE